MKAIEDMTIREIQELKEEYREDFIKVIKEFFKNHPSIKIISLVEKGIQGRFSNEYVFLRHDNYNKVSTITLKDEPTL